MAQQLEIGVKMRSIVLTICLAVVVKGDVSSHDHMNDQQARRSLQGVPVVGSHVQVPVEMHDQQSRRSSRMSVDESQVQYPVEVQVHDQQVRRSNQVVPVVSSQVRVPVEVHMHDQQVRRAHQVMPVVPHQVHVPVEARRVLQSMPVVGSQVRVPVEVNDDQARRSLQSMSVEVVGTDSSVYPGDYTPNTNKHAQKSNLYLEIYKPYNYYTKHHDDKSTSYQKDYDTNYPYTNDYTRGVNPFYHYNPVTKYHPEKSTYDSTYNTGLYDYTKTYYNKNTDHNYDDVRHNDHTHVEPRYDTYNTYHNYRYYPTYTSTNYDQSNDRNKYTSNYVTPYQTKYNKYDPTYYTYHTNDKDSHTNYDQTRYDSDSDRNSYDKYSSSSVSSSVDDHSRNDRTTLDQVRYHQNRHEDFRVNPKSSYGYVKYPYSYDSHSRSVSSSDRHDSSKPSHSVRSYPYRYEKSSYDSSSVDSSVDSRSSSVSREDKSSSQRVLTPKALYANFYTDSNVVTYPHNYGVVKCDDVYTTSKTHRCPPPHHNVKPTYTYADVYPYYDETRKEKLVTMLNEHKHKKNSVDSDNYPYHKNEHHHSAEETSDVNEDEHLDVLAKDLKQLAKLYGGEGVLKVTYEHNKNNSPQNRVQDIGALHFKYIAPKTSKRDSKVDSNVSVSEEQD